MARHQSAVAHGIAENGNARPDPFEFKIQPYVPDAIYAKSI